MNRHLLLVIFIQLLLAGSAVAQRGQYIQPYTMFQYTNCPNYNDYRSDSKLVFEPTYHFAHGFYYIFNSTDNFGFQTGLKLSKEGQKYSAELEYDVNTGDSTPFSFSSQYSLTQLEVPFMLRFSSSLEDENVILSISPGLQIDMLVGADMKTDPAPFIQPGNEIDLMNLFKRTNLKFITEASFSFVLTEKILINAGLQWSRSLFDIENKDFKFDKTKHVAEYYFPVSTKKETRPDISVRYKTTSMAVGLMLGISYWFNQP